MRLQQTVEFSTQSLNEFAAAGVAQARGRGGPILISAARPVKPFDPILWFSAVDQVTTDRVLFANSHRKRWFLGVGAARRFVYRGADRYIHLDRDWRELVNESVTGWVETDHPDSDGAAVNPVLLGGFRFFAEETNYGSSHDPVWTNYPDAALTLPLLQFETEGDGSRLTYNAVVSPDDDPRQVTRRWESLEHRLARQVDRLGRVAHLEGRVSTPGGPSGVSLQAEAASGEVWKNSVKNVVATIDSGRLEKAVLARRMSLVADRPFELHRVLSILAQDYPTSYLFAVGRGDDCFIGATPEQLVAKEGTDILAMGLAGSAPRGDEPEEDIALGKSLFSSVKNRREHQIVVDWLRSVLAPRCRDLEIPSPTLLRLPNVQHLHTPVSGTLRRETSLIELVAALHPTPAVGGHPRAEALRLIGSCENFDRGWYAAPVGWLDADDNGEFVVAIRSAILRGREATLFAGCGIVADSNPDAEYVESSLKLKPMQESLERALS